MSDAAAAAAAWISAAIVVCAVASCSYYTSVDKNKVEAARIERCEKDPAMIWVDGAMPWNPKCQERKK